MKRWMAFLMLLTVLPSLSGCVPVVVGTGAAVGYGTATDERTAGRMLDDTTLAYRVKAKLVSYSDVAARRITVDVVEGAVFLVGLTDSVEKKQAITDIVLGVKYVKAVNNLLIVGTRTNSEYWADKATAAEIKGALTGTPDVRSWNVYVSSVKGIIFLVGKIRTEEERKLVYQAVYDVKADAQIVDRILISDDPNSPGTSGDPTGEASVSPISEDRWAKKEKSASDDSMDQG